MTRPRLTPEEFADTVAYITAAWPSSRTWRDPETIYPLLQHLPHAALHPAAEEWFHVGHDQAPSPSTLAARALARLRVVDPDDPCRTGHVREITDIPGGYREGRCIRCGDTRTGTPDQLPTAGEREERRRQAALDATPTPDRDEPEDTPW
jgi:hypothetical protein